MGKIFLQTAGVQICLIELIKGLGNEGNRR